MKKYNENLDSRISLLIVLLLMVATLSISIATHNEPIMFMSTFFVLTCTLTYWMVYVKKYDKKMESK